jgi:MoxR-like ATPase
MVVAASNELAQDDGLGAMYDRLVFRRVVSPVKSEASFLDMLDDGGVTEADLAAVPTFDNADVGVLRAAVDKVSIVAVKPLFATLKNELARKHGIIASDRAWIKFAKIVRAAAVFKGRTSAIPEDLLVLVDTIWNKPEDRPAVVSVVTGLVSPDLAAAQKILDAAIEAFGKVDFNTADVKTMSDVNTMLGKMVAEAGKLDQTSEAIKETVGKVASMKAEIATATKKLLGL